MGCLEVCNSEQTAVLRLRYASPFLGSKGFLPDQSLQKGNGRDTLERCDVLLFGALSRTVSFFGQRLRLAPRCLHVHDEANPRAEDQNVGARDQLLSAVPKVSRIILSGGAFLFCTRRRPNWSGDS